LISSWKSYQLTTFLRLADLELMPLNKPVHYSNRVVLLVLAAVIGGASLHAQVTNLQFSGGKTFTYSTPFDYGAERYDDVILDEDGTSYLIGSSNGPLENDYLSTLWKAFVHKVDPEGNILREKVFKQSNLGLSGARILSLDASSLLVILEEGTGQTVWTSYRLQRLSKDTLEPLWTSDRRIEHFRPGATSYQLSFAADKNGAFAIIWRVLGGEQATAHSIVHYYNASGALQWQDTLGFQYAGRGMTSARYRDTELSQALSFAPNGDLVIGGSLPSPAVPKIARYTPSGVKIFELSLPNFNPGPISTTTVDDEGNAYAVNLVGSPAARKINLTKVSPSGAVMGAPVQLERLNSDYSTFPFYSLAFVHDYIVLFEDTMSGIGASRPHYHVFSKDLVLLQSGSASFIFNNTHPYSVSRNGFFIAAGASGRDAVRILRTFAPGILPTTGLTDITPPTVARVPPATTSRKRVRLAINISGDMAVDRLRFRIRGPGAKKFGRWLSTKLPANSGQIAARVPLALRQVGRWRVEVVAVDAAGNASQVRTVTVRRQ